MGNSVDKTELNRIIYIMRQHGESLSSYREAFLRRRIANRFRKTGVKTVSDYIHLLRTSPSEAKALKLELSVNVTEFFRDQAVWTEIQDIIEELRGKKKQIHIWSAGTASGEEAYSLAITAAKVESNRWRSRAAPFRNIKILGTDINRTYLLEAKRAVYPEIRIRNISPEDRKRFFVEVDAGWYQVREEIRRMVTLQQDDLSRSRVYRNMDLILCRNVMIYLSGNIVEDIWEKMENITKPGSYVILGKSEAIGPDQRENFESVDPVNRIYRRI